MILGIYGTGGTGREVYNMIICCPDLKRKWEQILFIDDTIPAGMINGSQVYPLAQIINKFNKDNLRVCIAVGEPGVKDKLLNNVRNENLRLSTIVHPDAFVSPDASMGEGIIVKKGVIVSSNAKVGDNTCLQAYSIVGHDVTVGMNCQISSFVAIGGFSTIGDNTYIGLHASVRDRVSIGNNAIISMGSVVQRDIPNGVIAMGNPARPMRKNEEGKVFK